MVSEPMTSFLGDDIAVNLQEHRRDPSAARQLLRRDAARCRRRWLRPARRGTGLPRDRSRLGWQDVLCRRKILHTGPGRRKRAFRQPVLRSCAATLRMPEAGHRRGAGPAIGGGLGLALVADFRVVAPEARFAANFVKLGIHPGFGITATLPRVANGSQSSSLRRNNSCRM